MPAEHHDLIGRAGNLGYRVVARPAFRIDAIDDVELELDLLAIREQPRDASVVLVAQDHGRNGSVLIVRVVGKRPDLTVVAAGVVHAHERAGSDQKLIHLRVELCVRQRLTFWCRRLLRGAGGAPRPAAGGAFSVWSTSRSSRRSGMSLNVTETC